MCCKSIGEDVLMQLFLFIRKQLKMIIISISIILLKKICCHFHADADNKQLNERGLNKNE